MEVELQDRKIRMLHGVKTRIEPEKLEAKKKNKNKASPTQPVGG
jgi:hypothetical protein